MTDNRTTELREKLTERGIEWTPRDSGFRKITYWKRNDGKPVYYADARLGILCMTCTPEQAIAATLGEPEIVRCRDCKYYHDGTTNGRRYAEPHCLAIGELAYGALFEVDEDCFCSWGERKEVD